MSENALDILHSLIESDLASWGSPIALVVEKPDRESDFVGLSKDAGYVDVMDHNAGVWRITAEYRGTGASGIRRARRAGLLARLRDRR